MVVITIGGACLITVSSLILASIAFELACYYILFAFAFPHLLEFMELNVNTVATLISSFVVVPAALRVCYITIFPFRCVKHIGDQTVCAYKRTYLRLILLVSLACHLITVILVIKDISSGIESSLTEKFKFQMDSYSTKYDVRLTVNSIQWLFQCCGTFGYKDWFSIDWKNLQSSTQAIHKIDEETFAELLFADIDSYPDLFTEHGVRRDSVPFSCCSKRANAPCIMDALMQLGSSTVNQHGCALPLTSAKHVILVTLLISCCVCVLLEVFLLILFQRSTENPCSYCNFTNINGGNSRRDTAVTEWERISNNDRQRSDEEPVETDTQSAYDDDLVTSYSASITSNELQYINN